MKYIYILQSLADVGCFYTGPAEGKSGTPQAGAESPHANTETLKPSAWTEKKHE